MKDGFYLTQLGQLLQKLALVDKVGDEERI